MINIDEIEDSALDLKSLEKRDQLNDFFWLRYGDNYRLNPIIRKTLLKITKDFVKDCSVDPRVITDVVITGSIANYNWSKYSDVDVHILVDLSKIDGGDEMLGDYFHSLSDAFNLKHDIKIKDYDLELNVIPASQVTTEEAGVYSLLHDAWISSPVKGKNKIEAAKIKNISKKFIEKIDYLLECYRSKKYGMVYDEAKQIKDAISEMRVNSLKKNGEFSTGNLIFKVLRRTGYIEKLKKLRLLAYDKMISL